MRAKRKTDNQRLLESNDLLRGALRVAISTLRSLERDEAVQADLAPVIAVLKRERQDALVLVEGIRAKKARVL